MSTISTFTVPEGFVMLHFNPKSPTGEHTIIPLPHTYEDAQSVVLSLFADLVPNPQTMNLRGLILCEGKESWCRLRPQDWSALVPSIYTHIGVFGVGPTAPTIDAPEGARGGIGIDRRSDLSRLGNGTFYGDGYSDGGAGHQGDVWIRLIPIIYEKPNNDAFFLRTAINFGYWERFLVRRPTSLQEAFDRIMSVAWCWKGLGLDSDNLLPVKIRTKERLVLFRYEGMQLIHKPEAEERQMRENYPWRRLDVSDGTSEEKWKELLGVDGGIVGFAFSK